MQQDIGPLARTGERIKSSGIRRLSVGALLAQSLPQKPQGDALTPGKVLSAFKKAAPFLGLPARHVHAVDWLFSFTRPIDWEPGSSPIVWPSSALMRESLGIGITQAKMLTRALIEAGLIRMKESSNGKRYGRRDESGRILEAFGFDLSPLAQRHEEFVAMTARGQEDRRRQKFLRRKASILRRGVQQIRLSFEVAGECMPPLCQSITHRLEGLMRAISKAEDTSALDQLVSQMERLHVDALAVLQEASKPKGAVPDESISTHVDTSVCNDRLGSKIRPHITSTESNLYLERDYVKKEGVMRKADHDISVTTKKASEPCVVREEKAKKRLFLEGASLHPAKLLEVAPRLKTYIKKDRPSWPDIVEAADWLRHELQVPQHGWSEACLAMGREGAAVSVALISTKSSSQIRVAPGAYLYGMIKAAKSGTLNLERSFWGACQRAKMDLRS